MKTWKSKRTVCRSRKSGRFVRKVRCRAFVRSKVRALGLGHLLKV